MKSRKANCWDNACKESFFRHFKTESFSFYSFRSSKEVQDCVKRYIRFYNN
ncbi:integrase core domain-containing protein [Bacillus sp. 37MA]|uniref:integrase core domain-containing protein n=1 Tax=Bacillaceae TaxID=186817 RepID=UPI0009DE0A75